MSKYLTTKMGAVATRPKQSGGGIHTAELSFGPTRRETLRLIVHGWFGGTFRFQRVAQAAGEHAALESNSHAVRRGDVLRFYGTDAAMHVWRVEPCTLTLATGWRVWYLRLVHNPARRFVERVSRAWHR